MDRQLTLNDGTVLDDSYAYAVGERMWVYIYADISLADAFALLNDPAKMLSVISEQFGVETTYEGYTELFTITKEDGGFISAGMRRDENVQA